jgi:hypothetical protein
MRWLLVVVALGVAGCGGSSAPAPAPSGPDFTHATCSDFQNTFTDAEREQAARTALTVQRRGDDLPAPTDNAVRSFVAAIDGTCAAAPRESLVQAAVFAYMH